MNLSFVCFLFMFLTIYSDAQAWLVFRQKFWNKLFGRINKARNPPPAPTSTTPPSTTPTPPTTTTSHCVPTSGYDESTNWCFGTFCDENGRKIAWDKWNCKPTPPSTSPPPPTTPPSTRPPGCKYNGRYYPPGTEITKGEDRAANWCWVVLCDISGNILHGDDFNCFPTTSPSTSTVPPTPTAPNVQKRKRRLHKHARR